jgi:outer membrane protein assembly factor BamB
MARFSVASFFICLLLAALVSGRAQAAMASRQNVLTAANATPMSNPSRRHAGSKINWPQLGFDAAHAGYNPYETTIDINNVSRLNKLWQFTIGPGNMVGSVIEAEGILYAPNSNGELYSLNAETGTLLWNFQTGLGFGYNTSPGSVAYDNGLLYMPCRTGSSGQGICAVAAQTGSLVWEYPIPGTGTFVGAAPSVAGGIVYFEGCSNSGCAYIALNETNGYVVWTSAEPCRGSYSVTPSIKDGLVFVGEGCNPGGNNTILALNAADGSVVWKTTVPGVMHGLSVADGRVAFATWSGYIEKVGTLNENDGKLRWLDEYYYWEYYSMPAMAYGRLYMWVYQAIGDLRVWRFGRGRERWDFIIARSFPTVANGVVYIACQAGGGPCALNAKSGKMRWYRKGTDNFGTPIVVNGTLYTSCSGSNVCAFRPRKP